MMNKTLHYDVNRPVHLGRRDGFIERASELFQRCLKEKSAKKRVQQIDTTLYYLESALEHSFLAGKSGQSIPMEESFILFIRMILFYLYSARAIMENEFQLENKQSPLWQFLHRNVKASSAEGFIRGSEQVLQDVSQFFLMVEEPYGDLQKDLIESMEAHDQARYTSAYRNLKKHVSSRSHNRHAVTYARTFYPTHAMKYG